jgi:ABC-type transport system substrate-binding protein
MKKALLISIAMLAILALSMVPSAFSFCIPPNPAADDGKWELFGPHIAGIKIKVYTSESALFTAMDVGQVDVEDWAINTAYATSWSTPNGPITLQNYGGENGYFLVDINNNATYENPAGSGLYVHNPTSDLALRRAIAAMTNRSHMVDFTGGLAQAIYTPVPSYMPGFINPSVPTYGGYYGNLTFANQILDANGYAIVGGWRIDPHTGLKLKLVFYSRGGDRNELGNDLNLNLLACHIDTEYHPGVPIAQVRGPVMANETFNLYTAGWTGIGPDPDYLCDLYNGSNYYHPGSPPNYDNVNYPETNHNLTTVKLAPDLVTGTAAMLDAQYWIAYYAALVPVWSYSGVKGYKNVPVETSTNMDPVTYPPTGDWKHLVNQMGFGVNSWWSFLDMQTYGNLYPGINVRYGWSGQAASQNVVYSQWYWDWEVLNKIYDGGWGRDPYTLLWGVPQLFRAYSIGWWIDPVTHENKSSVSITLRPDVYWQDGQPLTLADVYYTLVECSKDLLAKGLPPPWWYPTVQYMRSVEIIDDYNMLVLLDVQSAWAAGWVIGSTIIPKHIWKPIVDASTVLNNVVNGNTPDPNIIGSGPFKWFDGTGFAVDDVVVFFANTAGVQDHFHNTTSPGYYLYEPVWADIGTPNNLVKVNVNPGDASVTVPVTISLRNLWYDGFLIVNKYVYFGRNLTLVNGEDPSTLVPGYPIDVNLTTVDPYPLGPGHVEVINVTLLKKQCPYYLKVAIHIKGPATITYTELVAGQGLPPTVTYTIPNPWLSHWINVTIPLFITVKQDIGGTTYYDVMGLGSTPAYIKNELPAPDQKVDIKDIALAAKAFGSIPGLPNWNTVADLNGDYRIDIKDIANIAKQFGY